MPEQMLENRAYSLLAKLPVFEGVFFFQAKNIFALETNA